MDINLLKPATDLPTDLNIGDPKNIIKECVRAMMDRPDKLKPDDQMSRIVTNDKMTINLSVPHRQCGSASRNYIRLEFSTWDYIGSRSISKRRSITFDRKTRKINLQKLRIKIDELAIESNIVHAKLVSKEKEQELLRARQSRVASDWKRYSDENGLSFYSAHATANGLTIQGGQLSCEQAEEVLNLIESFKK